MKIENRFMHTVGRLMLNFPNNVKILSLQQWMRPCFLRPELKIGKIQFVMLEDRCGCTRSWRHRLRSSSKYKIKKRRVLIITNF